MDKKFKIGDVVYVSGNVRYKDAVGEVVDLSRNADFVVVKLYGVDGGNRSFHASDLTVETEEQAEKREEQEEEEIEIYFSFYNEEDHKGWVGKIRKSEVDGYTKWREVRLKGEDADKDWGNSTYMSYLSPGDLMTWVEKDYGRHYDVRGPFESRDEAREYMKKKFMLDEGIKDSIGKIFANKTLKNWDKLSKISKLMGYREPDMMSVDEWTSLLNIDLLDKVAQKHHKTKFLSLKLPDMRIILNTEKDVFSSKALKMLGESVVTEARKFKAGDTVHMGFAVKNGSGVDGTLDKIEGDYAFVKVKKGNKEEIVKGHAAYLSLSEGLTEEQTYSVGDKVETFVGGKWVPATITKPPHKETGNYGVRIKVKSTVMNTVSEPSKIRPLKENSLEELSSLDLNLASCDLLEAWIAIEQLYDEDEALLIFEALKEVRSQLVEGYGENNKDFQDWIKAVRKKHPNATLTGSEHQAQMIDWTTTNNALCGEWDGKKGTILEGVIGESEFLQRMLKHVSDKRNFRNTNTGLDDAAIADAKKVSKGKKAFDGINYKNDVGLMKDLLARGKRTTKKEKDLAKQYDQYNKQEEKGKTPKLPAGIKMFQDYIAKGKSIPGGRVVNYSTSGYSDEDDGDGDGGDGRLTPTNTALAATVEHFHNFLHHIAEEELLSCKVIHFEVKGDAVVFYAECRDDPRSEGFQKDLTDKLQARLNRHTFPGIGVVNCKVIHIHPAKDKIAK